jgi:phosphoribosylaminoimidazolecarboxamide formyltransferase / IMP cyclohydrolase
VDRETAGELSKLFVEAVAAPGYEDSALVELARKKNLRLMQVNDAPGTSAVESRVQLRTISGGLLAQTVDDEPVQTNLWKCATERKPSEAEQRALAFAWRVVKHVKSNAIVYARDGSLVGVGAGQMSRVDSVRLGASKARDLNHDLEGTVLASDAFFPFADGVEEAAKAGATAIIQPGGSIRDAEVIAAANRLGLAMVFTGTRHFLH